MLFNDEREIKVQVTTDEVPKVRDLIAYLANEVIKERKELFVDGETV